MQEFAFDIGSMFWHKMFFNDSGFAYPGVNVINSVKYPTYLTCSVVSLSLYPVKFRCCE